VPEADHCDASMAPARGWHSRGQEQLALDHDLIELVVPSFAPSCRRASEGSGLRITPHWLDAGGCPLW